MRFLIDVNAGGVVTQWLRSAGHDVVEVAARDGRMPDAAILRWAVDEERIIVTTDRDFEAMIYRRGAEHRGVVRLQNLPRSRRLHLIEHVLGEFADALAERAIVIADEQRVRVRRLSP